MPKISVIIPIYNVEEYLPQCLNTLIKQTLFDLEFICIDDGSTDNSFKILQRYANKDSRIKIISQTNHGQGFARNRGINAAAGEYIGFVDPDDWVELNMYEELYNLAKEYQADIAECNYEHHIENNSNKIEKIVGNIKILTISKDFNDSEKLRPWQFIPEVLLINHPNSALWNKIYKKSFLTSNQIYFADGRFAEDNPFIIHCRICNPLNVQCNKILYHYRHRNGSAVNITSNNRFDFFTAVQKIKQLLVQYNLLNRQSTFFYKYLISRFIELYISVPEAKQQLFLSEYKRILPIEYHACLYGLIAQLYPENWKDKFFSIKKIYKLPAFNSESVIKIYKIMTILGLKIKLKFNKA